MPNYDAIAPHVRARVIELANAGNRPVLIHREMEGKLTPAAIYGILQDARRKGEVTIRFPSARMTRAERRGLLVHVAIWKDEHAEKVYRAATARSVSASEIVNRIVAAALSDLSIDAILDDGVVS